MAQFDTHAAVASQHGLRHKHKVGTEIQGMFIVYGIYTIFPSQHGLRLRLKSSEKILGTGLCHAYISIETILVEYCDDTLNLYILIVSTENCKNLKY